MVQIRYCLFYKNMGALTLKVFSDELREWEFIEREGIDPTDGFGVPLRLSIRENQIFLAEPISPEIPWLTDRGRLFFDGMYNSSPQRTNWNNFFNSISEFTYFIDHFNVKRRDIFFLFFIFDNLNLETLNMLYILEQNCSSIKLRTLENSKTKADLESRYQLNNSTEKGKLQMSSLGVLLNTNVRYEGYVLNLNLRQRFLKGNFKLLTLGSLVNLTFPTYNLGSNTNILKSIGEGSHLSCQDLKNAEFPLLITSNELFKRPDFDIVFKVLKHIKVVTTAWNGLNFLHNGLGTTGVGLLNNFLPLSNKDLTQHFGLYFVNVQLSSTSSFKKLIDLQLLNIANRRIHVDAFCVDQNANTFINETSNKKIKVKLKAYNEYFHLPTKLFFEDNETYVNTEGSIKRITTSVNFTKNTKSSWQITRKLSANSRKLVSLNNAKDNKLLAFDSSNLFDFKNYINFQFYAVQSLTSMTSYLTTTNRPIYKFEFSLKEPKSKLFCTKLKTWLDDFFNSNGKNSFSYNSPALVNCSKIARTSSTNFF